MDKLQLELQRIFQDFELIVHGDLYTDLGKIFKHHGNAQEFFSALRTRLKTLKELGVKAIAPPGFEKLKSSGHFAMRFKGRHNIRILFNYSEKQELMLLAFDRKEGKGTSDYGAFFPEADSRYSELAELIRRGTL